MPSLAVLSCRPRLLSRRVLLVVSFSLFVFLSPLSRPNLRKLSRASGLPGGPCAVLKQKPGLAHVLICLLGQTPRSKLSPFGPFSGGGSHSSVMFFGLIRLAGWLACEVA